MYRLYDGDNQAAIVLEVLEEYGVPACELCCRQVEKILKHEFGADGNVLYQIKWLGYEKKSDMTWEPVENMYAPSQDHPYMNKRN